MDAFVVDLKAAALSNYTDTDRYREFRQVFLGTPQGKRVLHQILSWGHMYVTEFDPQPTVHAFGSGERNLALRIFAAVNVDPPAKPVRQNVRKDTNA